MAAFVTDGRLVELAIAVTLLEIVFLLVRRRMTGRGPAPRQYLPNAISGLCLMAALRAAQGDAAWPWIAAPVAAAGIAHAFDLLRLRAD
jgi:hypothetical protein